MSANVRIPTTSCGCEAERSRLSRWEKAGLVALGVLLVVFGAVVEIRSAFLRKRMTDLAVFTRAAWAIRSGADLYAIADDKGLHYNYFPFFAIVMTPLANPPAGESQAGYLPFAVSTAFWYLLSLGCMAWASHALASALEREMPDKPAPGSRRWWQLRLLPLLACVPAIALCLSLGQVTLLLLLLTGGMTVSLTQRKDFRAGLYLSMAICIKVFPAFLLLYPLWRRRMRCLQGCCFGLFLGLIAVPIVALGFSRTVTSYQQWARVMLLPAFGLGEDRSRAEEFLNVTATHNQSFAAILHKAIHPDRAASPTAPALSVRIANWVLGGLLTLVTLLVAGKRRTDSALEMILFVGAFSVIMLTILPAGHPHYYCLVALPLMGIVAHGFHSAHRHGLRWSVGLCVLNFVGSGLPALPGCKKLYDVGTILFAALFVWGMGLMLLRRTRTVEVQHLAPRDSSPLARAA